MQEQNITLNPHSIKRHIKRLQNEMSITQPDFKLHDAQEMFSKILGFQNYYTLKNTLKKEAIQEITTIGDFNLVIKDLVRECIPLAGRKLFSLYFDNDGKVLCCIGDKEITLKNRLRISDIENFINTTLNFTETTDFKNNEVIFKYFSYIDVEEVKYLFKIGKTDSKQSFSKDMNFFVRINLLNTEKYSHYLNHYAFMAQAKKKEMINSFSNIIFTCEHERRIRIFFNLLNFYTYDEAEFKNNEFILSYNGQTITKLNYSTLTGKDEQFDNEDIRWFVEKELKINIEENKTYEFIYPFHFNQEAIISFTKNENQYIFKVKNKTIKIFDFHLLHLTEKEQFIADFDSAIQSNIIIRHNHNINNESMLFSLIENHLVFHHKVFFSCLKNKKFSLSMKSNGIDSELEQDFKNYNSFLKSVEKHKPHIIIMDDIDDYDTFKLIKKLNKQGTRFIFINPSFNHKLTICDEQIFKIGDDEIFSLSQMNKL